MSAKKTKKASSKRTKRKQSRPRTQKMKDWLKKNTANVKRLKRWMQAKSISTPITNFVNDPKLLEHCHCAAKELIPAKSRSRRN
jgi:hypothetical protein